MHVWWVDRQANAKRGLNGPWGTRRFSFASEPVSPDGRFIAIESWRPRTDNIQGNYAVIDVFDHRSGVIRRIEIVNESPDPIGWTGAGRDLRLVFLKHRRWDVDHKQEWLLGDPETGTLTPAEKPPFLGDKWTTRVSPDGRRVARLDGQEALDITDVATGRKRRFTFHEDDRRFVHDEEFEWVSPRFLLLRLDRLAFLDAVTLKMSYPLPGKAPSPSHRFSPDFRWVIWGPATTELHLAPIIPPRAAPPGSGASATAPFPPAVRAASRSRAGSSFVRPGE
jgi:hypothetical protein